MSPGKPAPDDDNPAILSPKDCTLLNLSQLSRALNVSYDFVKDMRKAGFDLPIGGLTTLSYACEWLNRNPNFREKARTLRVLGTKKRSRKKDNTEA